MKPTNVKTGAVVITQKTTHFDLSILCNIRLKPGNYAYCGYMSLLTNIYRTKTHTEKIILSLRIAPFFSNSLCLISGFPTYFPDYVDNQASDDCVRSQQSWNSILTPNYADIDYSVYPG